MSSQLQLPIEVEKYENKPKTGRFSGKKRGQYKPRSKIKPFNLFKAMAETYSQLGVYFNFSVFNEESSVHEYRNIRIWNKVYKIGSYIYDGEICRGEPFKVTEAEIIGSEKLSFEERYFLHKLLLDLLKINKNCDEVLDTIKELTEILINLQNFPLFLFFWVLFGAKLENEVTNEQ